MASDFEVLPSGYHVHNFSAMVLHEDGQTPTNVIRVSDGFHIHLDWDTDGPLSAFLKGFWHVRAYLESIGPGQELELPGDKIALTPQPGSIHYHGHVVVPANTVKVAGAHPNESVPMKFVATVTYCWPDDTPGPMAGYIEGPILQFYNPN